MKKNKHKWLSDYWATIETDICPMQGWCYVIYNPYTKLFKIGHTYKQSLHERIKGIETQGGCYLIPIMAIQTEAGIDESPCDIEKNLQLYFKNKKVIGEWHSLTIRDIIQIKNLFHEIIHGQDIVNNVRSYFMMNKYTYIPGCDLSYTGYHKGRFLP